MAHWTKVCKRCDKEKIVQEFGKKRHHAKLGRKNICLVCASEEAKNARA